MDALTRPGTAGSREARVTIIAVAAALFLSSFSQTVVSTALPRIVGEFGGVDMYSWVLSASMFASTVAITPAGKLSDRFGRRPFLLGGIALFVTASVMTGLSRNMTELIAFRAVQGLAGGVITAASFATIGDLFEPAQRGRFMGLFTGVYALSSVAGPLVGGAVTDHLGWRWLFFANAPLGALSLAIIWRWLPMRAGRGGDSSIDWGGIALLSAGVLSLLFALTLGGDEFAWTSWQVAAMIAGAGAAFAALAAVELRASDPVLPPPVFRNRTYVTVCAVSFLTGMGLFGALSYMPLFIQGVLGASATNSGMVNTPLMVMLTAGSMAAGALTSRTRRYRSMVLAGGVVMAGGMAFMSLLDEHARVATALGGMAVVGLGLGLTMPLLGLAVQNALPDSQLGVSSASTQFFRQMGGTLGIAVSGSMLSARVHGRLSAELPPELTSTAPPETLRALESPNLLLSPAAMERMRESFAAFGDGGPALYDSTVAAMRGVLAGGLHDVFVAALVVSVAALAVSALLPDRELAAREQRTTQAEQWTEGDFLDEGRQMADVLSEQHAETRDGEARLGVPT